MVLLIPMLSCDSAVFLKKELGGKSFANMKTTEVIITCLYLPNRLAKHSDVSTPLLLCREMKNTVEVTTRKSLLFQVMKKIGRKE